MKRVLLLTIICLTGCSGSFISAQVPPSKADIVWSWTAPSQCTATAPCEYYVSVLAVPNGTTACPASTGNSYVPVNAGQPINALAYTDTGEGLGTTVCAIAQTAQSGLVSAWSVPSSPVVMPVSPPVPGAPSGAEKTAHMVKPALGGTEQKKELALSGSAQWK
ncbi:MAG TPA: hypothetical protein VFW94_24375 [Candidatus Acidoferrales bacterium]|nr:hypothetical protein [Candidatus Acidoferrales bacterium]